MGQILRSDKIGTLSHSSGSIIMSASPSSPAWLTIGGQQYKITSNLTRTISSDVTLIANTLYMIYAVRNSGNTELRISTNVNSIGPSGFIAWKLVGAFYSNGVTGSIAFGAFCTIEGVPTATQWLFTPTGAWTTNTTYSGQLERRGDRLVYIGYYQLSGAPNAVQQFWNMPTNLTLDTGKIPPNFGAVGTCTAQDSGVASYMGGIQLLGSLIYPYIQQASISTGVTNTAPTTWGNADSGTVEVEIPVVGWTNVPLKDL